MSCTFTHYSDHGTGNQNKSKIDTCSLDLVDRLMYTCKQALHHSVQEYFATTAYQQHSHAYLAASTSATCYTQQIHPFQAALPIENFGHLS